MHSPYFLQTLKDNTIERPKWNKISSKGGYVYFDKGLIMKSHVRLTLLLYKVVRVSIFIMHYHWHFFTPTTDLKNVEDFVQPVTESYFSTQVS